MATDIYGDKAQEIIRIVKETGDAVYDLSEDTATLAIVLAATEEVKKLVDPTSAVGRIMLGTILYDVSWKLGNMHRSFESLRRAAETLNPSKK